MLFTYYLYNILKLRYNIYCILNYKLKYKNIEKVDCISISLWTVTIFTNYQPGSFRKNETFSNLRTYKIYYLHYSGSSLKYINNNFQSLKQPKT